MTAVLLSAHVLAAIVLVGPITVAASLFPRCAAAAANGAASDPAARAVAATMHRITRSCAVVAVAVPVLGIATAMVLKVIGQPWVLSSLLITTIAGLLLGRRIVPLQLQVLHGAGTDPHSTQPLLRRLRAWTGLFSLAWAAVVVLMVLRPGSTTHV